MTARKTAARRVTAALAAAAVAFSGAVLLAPGASAADAAVTAASVKTATSGQTEVTLGQLTVNLTDIDNAETSPASDSVDLALSGVTITGVGVATVSSGSDAVTNPVLSDSGELSFTVPASTTDGTATVTLTGVEVTAPTNTTAGTTAYGTIGGAQVVSVTVAADEDELIGSTYISSIVVDDEDESFDANEDSVSVSDFTFKAESLDEGDALYVVLDGNATWASKPVVKIGSDTISRSKLTISGSTLTIPIASDYSGTKTVYLSSVVVDTGDPGAVALQISHSDDAANAAATADYFAIGSGTLSVSATTIARSSSVSVTYASVGAITLVVESTLTNIDSLSLVFTHEDDTSDLWGYDGYPTVSGTYASSLGAPSWTDGNDTGVATATFDVASNTLPAGTYRFSGTRLAAFASGEIEVTAVTTDTSDADTTIATAANVFTVSYSSEDRIAGTDRYATSAILAVAYWDEDDAGQDTVIVVNGEDVRGGADALSASYLAGVVDAPVVLVTQDAIPSAVLVALKAQVSANDEFDTIYILGEENAVSADVEDALYNGGLVDYASDIERISGDDRFATSAEVVQAAVDLGGEIEDLAVDDDSDSLTTAFLANGWTTVDALVAASVAYQGYPVLLTDGESLHVDVAAAIEDNDIAQIVVLGAEESVSEDVVAEVEDLEADDDDVVSERLAGATRFDTAALVNEIALDDDFGLDLDGSVAYLFDGFGFADALSASALVGVTGSVLVPTWNSELAGASSTFLSDWSSTIDTVTALGGTDRVDSTVLSAAATAAK